MAQYSTLNQYLQQWQGNDQMRHAIAETIGHLAQASVDISKIVSLGPLAGEMATMRGAHSDGDTQKELDIITNDIVIGALKSSPVAWMGSEETEEPIALNDGAPLVVNVDPLDGSSNIDTNVSIGTIFSVLPNKGTTPLLQKGDRQLAAGFIVYGPQTAIVLTLGEGTHIFWYDTRVAAFVLVKSNIKIAAATNEYAINASNCRHWSDSIKGYITDIKLGAEGPRKKDYNMRWVGSLVADAFRIFTRGGIYLYPGDARKGYNNGRLRLLYEANPLAMIVEQADGLCTSGQERIMEIKPTSLHQRAPLIFGSKNEVEEVMHYFKDPHSLGDRSPLFSQRGLFRSPVG